MNIRLPDMMTGSLDIPGLPHMRGGFQPNALPPGGLNYGQGPGVIPAPNRIERMAPIHDEIMDRIRRGESTGDDLANLLSTMANNQNDLSRVLTSSEVPVRENLEAPALNLIPEDTPIRNLLPRVPGAGTAAAWKQITSLGGGWGSGYDQPGGGSALQLFYAETGAPVSFETVYANKTSSYKLMGALRSITGFAMATGATYQDQLAVERQNALLDCMLNEEFALLWGDSTDTAVPWGDGSNALAFDGLMNLVTTANGVPSAQISAVNGAWTLSHIDLQISRIWNQGGKDPYLIINQVEARSLINLLQAANSIYRLQIPDQRDVTAGFRVAKFVTSTGMTADIYLSRFQIAGNVLYGSRKGPDGAAAATVNVLPQVPAPQGVERPNMIQGYTLTDLARTLTAPDVHPFMISVYETLQLKNAKIFAKDTGVTAV